MSARSKTLHDVTAGWESDAGVLRHWGHVRQARVVSHCREALEEQIADEGRVSVGTVLSVWSSDAVVLERYGHPEEAVALRRCVDSLREIVNGAGAREDGDARREESARDDEDAADEVYVSRHYGRERASGDPDRGSAATADAAGEDGSRESVERAEEASAGPSWSA